MMVGLPPFQNELLDDSPTFILDIDEIDLPVCKYIELKDIHVCAPPKYFSLLLFNIRSCRRNFTEFECYFHEYFKNFSCIALVETWLTEDYDNLFSIHGFRSFNVYRTPSGGGIRLYCKECLQVTHVPEFSFITDVCEMITAQVSCNDIRFVLSVFYHPPSSDHDLNNMFVNLCCEKLRIIQAQGHPMVACGDFNLNLLNPMKYGFITEFISCMLELGLYPIVNIPTKYNPENEVTKYSIIDQVWTSMPTKISNACVFPYGITDHFPVMTSFAFSDAAPKPNIPMKRTFNNKNNDTFAR